MIALKTIGKDENETENLSRVLPPRPQPLMQDRRLSSGIFY